MSLTGCALEVSNPIGIPADFVLAIPEHGLTLSCRVVWRRGFRFGVAFD
ncbi:PilZ domain-containing protein [Bradyrhizobium sp.]